MIYYHSIACNLYFVTKIHNTSVSEAKQKKKSTAFFFFLILTRTLKKKPCAYYITETSLSLFIIYYFHKI